MYKRQSGDRGGRGAVHPAADQRVRQDMPLAQRELRLQRLEVEFPDRAQSYVRPRRPVHQQLPHVPGLQQAQVAGERTVHRLDGVQVRHQEQGEAGRVHDRPVVPRVHVGADPGALGERHEGVLVGVDVVRARCETRHGLHLHIRLDGIQASCRWVAALGQTVHLVLPQQAQTGREFGEGDRCLCV